MNELALFAGAGGGLLASKILGWTTVGAVEINLYCQKVLMQRQEDGIFEPFPIWDDVQTFDGKPWRGTVGIITGGFPCTDISSAGKGAGIRAGKNSGLWREFARIIGEVGPPFAFIENSPLLVSRGLDIILGDLAELGYDARWLTLGAWHLGGHHKRNRMFILAYPDGSEYRRYGRKESQDNRESSYTGKRRGLQSVSIVHDTKRSMADSDRHWRSESRKSGTVHRTAGKRPAKPSASRRDERGIVDASLPDDEKISIPSLAKGLQQASAWVWDESRLDRVSHGVANRLHRVRAIGNGQIPQVVATAFLLLSEGLIE